MEEQEGSRGAEDGVSSFGSTARGRRRRGVRFGDSSCGCIGRYVLAIVIRGALASDSTEDLAGDVASMGAFASVLSPSASLSFRVAGVFFFFASSSSALFSAFSSSPPPPNSARS